MHNQCLGLLDQKFDKGMSRQRSNTLSRLRNEIEAVFSTHLKALDPECFKDVSDVLDERASLADLIGGKKNTAQKITYHPFAALVLHSDGSTSHNPETFLHSKLIMHVSSIQKI
jgi:chorismate mutase